jgi:hypothetical protein
MHPVVLLATGYAGLLLAAAAALERLARHTAARSHRYRTAGFTYRPDHDLWLCPRQEPLWPAEVDRQHRVVRYRARPTVCNACPDKHDCTTSPAGREVVRPLDPWPHSEAGRFHRAVSVTLAALAGAFVAVTAVPHHRPADLAVLVPAAALTGWAGWRWARDFLHTPSGFPDDPAPASPAAPVRRGPGRGPVPVDLLPPSRRRTGITWASDGRPAGSRYASDRRGRATAAEEELP